MQGYTVWKPQAVSSATARGSGEGRIFCGSVNSTHKLESHTQLATGICWGHKVKLEHNQDPVEETEYHDKHWDERPKVKYT
jgi:hypothetical protein